MVSSIRRTDIINSTGALLPFGSPVLLCNKGQDVAFELIEHTFVASEIGTAAGQTLDTTSNPTMGFLLAQFQGARIIQIVHAVLKKDKAGANTTIFRSFAWASATGPSYYNIALRSVNQDPALFATTPGYDPNYASIFLLDTGSAAASQIAVGDRLVVLVALGNS